MGRPHVCPFCGAGKSVSKGVRKTKTMGDRRIRLCKACGRKFTPKSQKPMATVEEKPAETCVESDRPPETAAAQEPREPDMSAGDPEAQPADDEAPEMVPPPDKEWAL